MFDLRAFMLDPARLIERRHVYREYIAFAAQWNYNALFWHFTDDQGCAVRLPSRPELASPHAYSAADMRALIAFAAAHGIEIIPEVECFGHTGFITAQPRYQHLRDGLPGKGFGAMCVFAPEARTILRDLLRDTAALFPSPYLHAGLDETVFGAHPVSQRRLADKPKHALYAEHVCWVHDQIRRLGKTMLMWADHLYPIPPRELAKATYLDAESINSAIAAHLPRDIIMCVWQYNPKPRRAYVEHLQRLGFRVLVCPATSAWGVLVQPRKDNLQNLADSARLARRSKAMGMINTLWCPQRYFPGVTFFGLAFGAACRDTRKAKAVPPYTRFARAMFGIAQPRPVGAALKTLHAVTPHKNILERVLPVAAENQTGIAPHEWRALRTMFHGAARAHKQLTRARATVRRNRVYYDDLLFSAECLAELGTCALLLPVLFALRKRADALRADGRANDAAVARRAANVVHAGIRRRTRALLRTATQRWRHTRFTDDPKRLAGSAAVHGDALLARLAGTVQFYTATLQATQ